MSTGGIHISQDAAIFGRWLSQQRKARDLTQEDLAERLGCSASSIQKIEVGDRRPSKQIAELLADYFGIPPDEERVQFLSFARGSVGSVGHLGYAPPVSVSATTTPYAPAGADREGIVSESAATPPGQFSTPNNLPLQLTSFVGRAAEVPRVRDLLLTADVHLLTLTGPPGTGKTRLALHVATDLLEDFDDGVFFVDLAPLTDPALVISAIAETLAVGEGPGRSLQQAVASYIGAKRLLLLLDNFEQVLEAAPLVAQLLAVCPQLKVLVTSRAPLHIRGEKEYAVPPLYLPDLQHLPGIDELSRYEAVRLFVERATDVRADFKMTADNARAVAEICVRLDGLPLAIELAAARIRSLPPQAMLTRLEHRLKVLTGGGRDLATRQQTLKSTIDWSYDLLPEPHKQLFRRMAVFQGGRTLRALEAVCNYDGQLQVDVLDGVETLLSNNLLQQQEGSEGEPRFRMLETIHEYAREKLEESGEEAALLMEHALYFMKLAEEAAPHLLSARQQEWFDELSEEYDNLRAALQWSRYGPAGDKGGGSIEGDRYERAEAVEVGLRISTAIAQFWQVRGYFSEGREHLGGLLEKLRTLNETEIADVGPEMLCRYKANALTAMGNLAGLQGDYEAALSLTEEGLDLRRELGDKLGIATSLNNLGFFSQARGDYEIARSLHEESLALRRELGDKLGIAYSLYNLGVVAQALGDYKAARSLHEVSLDLKRELGNKWSIAYSLYSLGAVAEALGNLEEARSLYMKSLALREELGDKRGIAASLAGLGRVALAASRHREGVKREEVERGARLLGAAEGLLQSIAAVLSNEDRLLFEGAVATFRDLLGEEEFEQARQEGRSMSQEQAITSAMETSPEPDATRSTS